MSTINMKMNVQLGQQAALAAAAQSLNVSKSSLANAALKAATENFTGVVQTLLKTPKARTSKHKPASFVIDKDILEATDNTAARLYLSRDHFLRLALDYYLYHAINKGQPLKNKDHGTD